MATYTYKILAQNQPTATTLTDFYTCASASGAAITSLMVCNTTGTAATFRVSVAAAGAADNVKQYLFYDVSVAANTTIAICEGLTVANTDVIRIKVGTANSISFNLFGTEIS